MEKRESSISPHDSFLYEEPIFDMNQGMFKEEIKVCGAPYLYLNP